MFMSKGRLLYAQSGGVTAVINASASAVLAQARARKIPVYAGKNGILGILREQMFDTAGLTSSEIKALANTPGGAFGSCRFKLKSLQQDAGQYQRLLDVFKAHDIRYFLYNGGNDSADTALKISQLAQQSGYALTCVAVPKTVDNDLVITDCCPGFGSAARYTAVSVLEAAIDVEAMAETSTKVFVYEVMGLLLLAWLVRPPKRPRTSSCFRNVPSTKPCSWPRSRTPWPKSAIASWWFPRA